MHSRGRLVLALAMLFATSAPAAAERLLTPVAATRTPGAAGLPGVARTQALALGPSALAELRERSEVEVADFPLAGDGLAVLELARFQAFSAGARVEVVGEDGVRQLPLPDEAYFAGSVRGDPVSRVLLIAARDEVHGFVATGGQVYAFGSDGAGGHRAYALRDVSLETYPPPRDFCTNDFHRAAMEAPAAEAQALGALGAPPLAAVSSSTLVQADVAIDTDYELRQKFGSDQATLSYLASLVAASTAIYERDLKVRLVASYVRIFSTPADPWSAPANDTYASLQEVRTYWLNAANNMATIAGPRDLVHFISGKAVYGGIAYVSAVCSQNAGFGLSQVYGNFNLSVPSQIWDVLVVTHETGHIVGSQHTHCYSPPVDKCYNQEGGCWNGAVVATRGTIMSYCHLLAGGLSNIDLLFGNTVSTNIRSTVNNAACLAPVTVAVCGNGVVENGEECDDGNTVVGDGCSASCQREPRCGDGFVDAPEQCDDGNTRAGDGCSASCQREPRCGDGIVDAPEQCDDGNTRAGDGCSASCQREPRCGDGVVGPGEECDDGNVASDDGCSAVCRREPCLVVTPLQTTWLQAAVSVSPRRRNERLTLLGEFGLPVGVDTLAPDTDGLRLRIESAAGVPRLDLTLPPGGHWSARGRRWAYRDASGEVGGIRSLSLRDRTTGGVPGVLVSVVGRGAYALTAADLPLRVLVVLGDPAAGLTGACARHSFSFADCRTKRGGRLECH